MVKFHPDFSFISHVILFQSICLLTVERVDAAWLTLFSVQMLGPMSTGTVRDVSVQTVRDFHQVVPSHLWQGLGPSSHGKATRLLKKSYSRHHLV